MAKPMTRSLTQAELAEARRGVAHAQEIWPDDWQYKNWVYGGEYARLLATVDAYREIATAVAPGLTTYEDMAGYDRCDFCEQPISMLLEPDPHSVGHTPGCPVTKARALLGTE